MPVRPGPSSQSESCRLAEMRSRMKEITEASDDFTQSLFKALISYIASHSCSFADYYPCYQT